MIKYGDIAYFTLLELQSKLRYLGYDKLDLLSLDKLRYEVDLKIQQINYIENERIKNDKNEK